MEESKKKFSSVHNHLSKKDNGFGVHALIPGLPHLLSNKQVKKGSLLLFSFALSIFATYIIIVPESLQAICSKIPFFGLNKSNEEYMHFPLFFRILYILFILGFQIYLILENEKDIQLNFCQVEKDKKCSVFASSISSSFILSASSLIGLLMFTLLYFNPIQIERSMELELATFVDNLEKKEETKVPPKTKNIAVKNSRNSGEFNSRKAPSPTINQNKQNTPKSPAQQLSKNNISPNKPSPNKQSQNQSSQTFSSNQPIPKPKSLNNKSSAKPLLPRFKPKVDFDEKTILTSTNQAIKNTNFIPSSYSSSSPYSPSQNSSNSGKGPVLPSRPNGFSNGTNINSGLGNSGFNNNPNGPITIEARKNVDWGPYVQDLRNRIHQVWNPIGKNSKEVLSFTIKKDGTLVPGSIKVKSSTSPETELAAIKAIQDASSRFRPFPEGAGKSVTFDWTFTLVSGKAISTSSY